MQPSLRNMAVSNKILHRHASWHHLCTCPVDAQYKNGDRRYSLGCKVMRKVDPTPFRCLENYATPFQFVTTLSKKSS